jgi:hypothetical protein
MNDCSEIQDLLARITAEKRVTSEINSRIAALNRSDLCFQKKTQLNLNTEADGLAILRGLAQNMIERHKAFSEASHHFELLADLCKKSADAIQKITF